MGLNIKNDETCRLAVELAILTGETKTGAITVALRERLEREKRRKGAETRTRELLAIAERCASLMGSGPSAVEHGDTLHDEQRPAQVIVDTSALLAILNREPDANRYMTAVLAAARCRMSVANVPEAAIVVESRGGAEAGHELDAFLGHAGIEPTPATA